MNVCRLPIPASEHIHTTITCRYGDERLPFVNAAMNNFVDGAQKFRERYTRIYTGPQGGGDDRAAGRRNDAVTKQDKEDAKLARGVLNPLHRYV